jgi:hypothetical protein
MDSSLGLALSTKSPPASFPAVLYEAGIALASKAKDSEGIEHSAAPL